MLFDTKPLQLNPRDILYKGKTAQELTHKELIECALFLKDAHLHLVRHIDELNVRIKQLESALVHSSRSR